MGHAYAKRFRDAIRHRLHDLAKSSASYRDILGFTIHSIPDPGFRFYPSGECTIWAGQCPDALAPADLGDRSYFAYLEIDDIDSYYDSVPAKGARISKTIRNEPGGMGEFGLVRRMAIASCLLPHCHKQPIHTF